MTKLELTDDFLVRLWHTDETAVNLAYLYSMEDRTLLSQWRRLRQEGKLPNRTRQISDSGNRQPDRGYDGRPSVGDFEDPLLAKLYEIHPERMP